MMQRPNLFVIVLACFAALEPHVYGHSWVEQLMVIGQDGSFVGEPGYPRANVQRSTPGFGDPAMVNLIPGNGGTSIQDSEPMCKATQAKPNQSNGSPALKATPGSLVALRYQENGHVSLPHNQPGKAENRGSVYIYGTNDPQPTDTFLKIHKVWNADGSGGDKRGKLLAVQNFDDGQCYQINDGSISQARKGQFPHATSQLMGQDLWCQNDIRLPSDATAGKLYTLYWVWDWPTAPNVDPGLPKGKAEIYTTCMDIEVANDVSSGNSSKSNKSVQQKDVGNSAISSLIDPLLQESSAPTMAPGLASSTSISSPVSSPISTSLAFASLNSSSSTFPLFSFRPSTTTTTIVPVKTSALGVGPTGTPSGTASASTSRTRTSLPQNTCACQSLWSSGRPVKREVSVSVSVSTATVTITATATIYPSGTCLPSTAATTLVKRAVPA